MKLFFSYRLQLLSYIVQEDDIYLSLVTCVTSALVIECHMLTMTSCL